MRLLRAANAAGTDGDVSRGAGQSRWFRLWLWVLLWGMLTSGVEPSQRAAGKAGSCVDLQSAPGCTARLEKGSAPTTTAPSTSDDTIAIDSRDPTNADTHRSQRKTLPGITTAISHNGRRSASAPQRDAPSSAAGAQPDDRDPGSGLATPSSPAGDGTSPSSGRSAWVSRRRVGEGKQAGRFGAAVVRLEPRVLHFGESPLCIPTSATVEVKNHRESQMTRSARTTAGRQKGCPWTPEDNPSRGPPECSRGGEGYEGDDNDDDDDDMRQGAGGGGRVGSGAGDSWIKVAAEGGGGRGGGGGDGWVRLLSVTSDNPQFHPASFQPQALPPEGETSFQVVFLPQAVGAVDAVLTVATSAGDIRYRVQANAVENPHKVHPIVVTNILVGSTYTGPIAVYNPLDEAVLSITEVFTTEGFLRLVMPESLAGGSGVATPKVSARKGGVTGAGSRRNRHHHHGGDTESLPTAFRDPGQPVEAWHPKPPGLLVEGSPEHRSAWRIPPGAELEVIRVSFTAETTGEFQGYVHIRTDGESMVVPVELHVSRGGVDPSPLEVDFGVLTSSIERRQASVSLYNGGTQPILILGASVSNPDPRINVGFREGTVIGAGEGMDDAVRLVYSGGEPLLSGGEHASDPAANAGGKVLIAVNHTTPELSIVEIGYRAHVLHGGVAYEWGQVSFQVDVGGGSDSLATAVAAAAKAMKAPAAAAAAAAAAATSSGNARYQGRNNIGSSRLPEQEGGGGEKRREQGGDWMVETRVVELKNHFPVAMQLLSLSMEDCRDILSVSGVDPTSPASVALPQASWEGVRLSFRRSGVAAAAEAEAARSGGGDLVQSSPSSAPPALEPKLTPEEEARLRPLMHDGDVFSTIAVEDMGGDGDGRYPSPDNELAYPVEGEEEEDARESIPSVSADQRTLAERKLADILASLEATAVAAAVREEVSPRVGDDSRSSEEEKEEEGSGGSGGVEVGSLGRSLPFTCTLRAETNASTHQIPVFVFDGSLHYGFVADGGSGGGAATKKRKEGGGFFGGADVRSGWPKASKASPTVVAGLPPDSRSAFVRPPREASRNAGSKEAAAAAAAAADPSSSPPSASAPPEPRPLVVDLGIIRAGATGRRRFNVTNLNPVEVNVTNTGGGGELPFASLRLVGVGPLPRAPQALSEIGRHIQARSLHNTAAAAATAGSTCPPTGGATAASGATATSPGGGGGGGGCKHAPDRSSSEAGGRRESSLLPHELVRETVEKDGRVSNREEVVLGGGAGKKAWGGGGTRRSRGRGGSRQAAGKGGGGEGHVCTLVPGATAMFEVAATAPEEVVDGTVKMEVSGLQLSTPVETVPVVVTYSAICGGIFFHAPAVGGGSSAPHEPGSSSSPPLPRVPHGDPPDGTTGASHVTPENERILDAEDQQQQQQHQQSFGAARGRNGQAASAVAQSVEAAQLEQEDGGAVTVHLDDAFPGKVTVSPVSLRSTAAWEGRVEGMESSGPLIKATLARRDVPGVSVGGGGQGTSAGVPGGIAAHPAVVEVGRVEYDAARDCAEVNAWTCLARTVEEASHRRRNSQGGSGGGGDSAALLYEKQYHDSAGGEELELTLMRLVEALHDDSRVVYQSAPQQDNASPSVGGIPGDVLATYRCGEGHVITVEMEDPSLDSELEGCDEPRFVAGAGKALAAASWGGGQGGIGLGGNGAASVNDRSTAAAKELWGLLPSIAASGLNRFREEVSVSTTLGPAARPLEVLVSLTVPRLVVGVAASEGAAPCPHAAEAAANRRASEGCGGGAAAAAACASSGCPYDQKRGSRPGYGGDGVPALRFPLTQVGKERDVFVEVANPADVPVSVQLSVGKTDSLVWKEPGKGGGKAPAAAVIAVGIDLSSFARQHRQVRHKGAGDISAFHIRVGAFPALVLPPGGAATIGPLRFTPARTGTFSAHVYLRNNLTHLEPVRLEGEAGEGLLSVRPWEGGGARPGRVVVAAASTVPEQDGGSTEASRFGGGGNADATLGQQQQQQQEEGEEAHDQEEKGEEQRQHHPRPPALEVERFPVNFRSWAKSPPTTTPVVRRWVLSNEGTMPLVVHGVGIRRTGASGWGWGWGRRGAGGRDPSGSGGWFGRRWRALLGGGGGGGNNAERDVSSSMWGLWGAVSAAPATTAAAGGGGSIASSVMCADGGFRVLGEACQDRWRPKTLLPGQDMEVAVDYSAAHCEPVGRTLDFLSSAGTVSIRMEASASGGPSAVAACKSARRAAAAAAAAGVAGGGKGKASGGGGASSDGGGGGGGDARWSRAWLLVKTVVFAGALYTGGCAMLGVGPEVSQLLGLARRARARAAGCYAALLEGCGRIAVLVEVRASAAVVVSPPSDPLSSSEVSRSSLEGSKECSGTIPGASSDSAAAASAPRRREEGEVSVPGNGKQRDSAGKGKRAATATARCDGRSSAGLAPGGQDDSPVDLGARRVDAGKAHDGAKTAGAGGGGGASSGSRSLASSSSTAASTVGVLASPGRASKPQTSRSTGEKNRIPEDQLQQQLSSTAAKREQTDDNRWQQQQQQQQQRRLPQAVVTSTGHQQNQQQRGHPRAVAAAAAVAAPAAPSSSAASLLAQHVRRGKGGAGANGAGGPSPSSGPSPFQQTPFQQRKGNGGRGGGGGYPHYRGPGGGGGYGGGNRGQHQQQQYQWVSSSSHHGNWSPGRGGGGSGARGPLPHGRMSSPNSSPRFSSSSPGSPHLPALSSPAAASASMGVVAAADNNSRGGRQQHQPYRSRPSAGGDRHVGRRGGGEFRNGGHANAPAGDGGARTAAPVMRMTTFAPGATAGQGSAAAASSRFEPRPTGPVKTNAVPPSSGGGNATRSAGAGWLGVEAGGVEPFQRPLWASSESSNQQQRSPALGPTGAAPLARGNGGIGASPTLTGLHASPPLAPIGSNRHRRQSSDGSGSSLSRAVDAPCGSSRRSPPGLPPPPAQQRQQQQQPMGSLLGALGAAAAALPSAGRDPDLDNLETFATASAVAAGVLDIAAGEGGGPTVPLERCNERTHPAASLDAGTAAEDDARNGRSFSVPSMYFGQQHAASPPAAAAAAAANGSQYGRQQGLAFGATGSSATGVFDGAIMGAQQGRFAFHQAGGGGLAPARTVGGAVPAAAAAASGGSRLGFYMSAGGGGGGGGGGGRSADDVFGFMNDGDQK